jgi:hypothetical protein
LKKIKVINVFPEGVDLQRWFNEAFARAICRMASKEKNVHYTYKVID